MNLTEYPPVPYTLFERQLWDLIPKDGASITVNEIVRARKAKGAWNARYPSHVVATVMKTLIDKIGVNDEIFRIRRLENRRGSEEMRYWVEPKDKPKRQKKSREAPRPPGS